MADPDEHSQGRMIIHFGVSSADDGNQLLLLGTVDPGKKVNHQIPVLQIMISAPE